VGDERVTVILAVPTREINSRRWPDIWTRLGERLPVAGTKWNSVHAVCSDGGVRAPAFFLGEIWGTRRADAFDECCRPS
jgi:hypothetical protein